MPASDSTAAVAVTDAATDAVTDPAAPIPDTTVDFTADYLDEVCGPGNCGSVACVNAVGQVGYNDSWTQLTVTVDFDVGGLDWCTKGTLDLSFRDFYELSPDGVKRLKTLFASSPDNGARQEVDSFFRLYADYVNLCFQYQQTHVPDGCYTGFDGQDEEDNITRDAILAFFARFPGCVKERDEAELCEWLPALLK